MKKLAKNLLVLTAVFGCTLSSLHAQDSDYYTYEDTAFEVGGENGMQHGWWGWLAAAAAIGGLVAIAVTNNSTSHND